MECLEAPLCECHGEPKVWRKDNSKKDGGSWACSEKRRISETRYGRSEKGKAKRARYKRSPKGRAWEAEYKESGRGAEAKARYYENNREELSAKNRERYDKDPIYRIGKLLHDNARKRSASLKRMEARIGPL